MAYQPKSYRKFIAGAAAVAVVAPVVAPVASLAATNFTDVEDKYKEAVDFLVSKGINGINETTFGTQLNIKRVDAAVFVAQALDLDTENAPDSGFTDVPDRAKGAVNALKEAGITSGKTETTFAAQQEITRGELAIWLQKAFNLEGGSEELAFTDVSDRYDEAVQALVANEITVGTSETTFGTQDNAKRGDFALFIKRAVDATAVPTVESVSATNAKTLSLSGTGLQNLKAEDITVEGNTVASVNSQGKSATVTLETPLVDGQEYKVSVKTGEETKEFTVEFKFVLADVAVTTTTLEANKDKQFLQVTLNGEVVDLATIDSLGYEIEFQADKDVFVGSTNISTTGEIDETLSAVELNKSFDVKVVLTKDGKTVESKTVTVKVESKATPAIGDIVLETSELELNKAIVSTKDSGVKVKEVVSNTEDVIDVSGLSSFASSNPEVATINASTGEITPIKAGKTTITVTAGKVTYSKEITVVSEDRKATKATANNVTIAPGSTLEHNVTITDQFGEKLESTDILATGDSKTVAISEVTGEAGVTAANATKDGKLPVTVAPAADAKAGTYTVVVKDLTTLKNIGQFTVKVSADNVADNYKLEVADDSKGVINLADTTPTLKLNAKEFTKSGAYLQTLDSGDTAFTVESVNPTIATVSGTPDDNGVITVTGEKVGTTQIILKKNDVQVATATVTVKEEVPTIESITWKNNGGTVSVTGKAITYKDIFTTTATASGIDTIVEGVKLNENTTSKVRLDLDNTAKPVLYLDQNDDGNYVAADDEILGTVAAQLTGSAGETIVLATTQDWESEGILDGETASGDKGTIIITVTDDDNDATVRASSTLNVNVK